MTCYDPTFTKFIHNYCPECYKLKKDADMGGIHCDVCVLELTSYGL